MIFGQWTKSSKTRNSKLKCAIILNPKKTIKEFEKLIQIMLICGIST